MKKCPNTICRYRNYEKAFLYSILQSGQSWDGREEYRVERESNGSQELNSEEDDGVISIVNEDVQEESEDEETDGMDEDITD